MFRGMSIGSLLLILAIVLILFGTKRLRHFGEDLGNAFRGFHKGLKDTDEEKNEQQ